MGICWGSVFRRRKIRRHIVLILIGLDNAGKTRTVNKLAGDRDDNVLPTVGFKAINLVHKDTPVTIYDLGGGPQFRQIWSQYYSEVHGVIFVIDSSDFSRLDECKEVFEEVLSHDKISGKPVLVLANKQDKSGALDDIDIVEKLNIEPLVNRCRCPTLVESYTANTLDNKKRPKIDPGLKKGYQWLLNYIVKRYGDINLRVQTDIHADLERRKRLLSKVNNIGSQTFTAVSDEIGTQTGFENPNFELKNSESEENKDQDPSLIIVKPVTRKGNSVDTTITIESVDDSDAIELKPKLSPLFGRPSNSSSTETTRIELEAKTEFSKLSPIVRNVSAKNRHINFQNRPQSSPTSPDFPHEESPNRNSSIEEQVKFSKDSHGLERKHRVLISDIELAQMNREVVLTERDYTSKPASLEATPGTVVTLPLSARPASASQLVRRQLELTSHKRRLSLRYIQRNKTNPERVSMLMYEPTKAPQRLDKGDFEHCPTIN